MQDFDAKVSKINQMISNAKKRVESDRGRLEELKPVSNVKNTYKFIADGALCSMGFFFCIISLKVLIYFICFFLDTCNTYIRSF